MAWEANSELPNASGFLLRERRTPYAGVRKGPQAYVSFQDGHLTDTRAMSARLERGVLPVLA